MAANQPFTVSGTGSATITPPSPKRMSLVANRDTTNAIDVAWNGGSGAWRLDPGEKKGNYVVGGVVSLTITPVAGSPAWQVELYD